MFDENEFSLESFLISDQRLIMKFCDQFEGEIRKNHQFVVEQFPIDVNENLRGPLTCQLIILEVDLRHELGLNPTLDEYTRRFPSYHGAVRYAFRRLPLTKHNYPKNIDEYVIENYVNEGRFGIVFKAVSQHKRRTVALKLLRNQSSLSKTALADFLREGRSAAKLDHPGIVKTYELRSNDSYVYIVMEFIDGIDLATSKGLQRSPVDIARIVQGIAGPLAHAHRQGIYHRDLKPSNILIDSDGNPRIADFGMAIRQNDRRQHRFERAGSPSYMSPEMARGESHLLNGGTDIWSLGVIFYELLVGFRPFDEPGLSVAEVYENIQFRPVVPPRQVNPEIPLELERICLRCLCKQMSDRYSTASDVAEELSNWLAAPFTQSPIDQTPVVPQGLRAYGRAESDSFIRLLPGPTDSKGVPQSILFWVDRLGDQSKDAISTCFIYGPSGSGKSSFVRAGVLPRLDSRVIPIYVEATAEDTEVRTLKALRKQFPDIPVDLSLPEVFRQLRDGYWIPVGRKVAIVLDQFEQWLHARKPSIAEQLIQAIRHCDGKKLQCIVLVRDDFWLATTQFKESLEVELRDGQNASAIHRFDLSHARNVLLELGIAYGKLPDNPDNLTKKHRKFVEKAIEGLAEDERVIPVRLSLFAEMFKHRNWLPSELEKVGGIDGVGVTFLEETFSAKTALPKYKLYEKAVRAVLEQLLPDSGIEIRGHMRTLEELGTAANQAQNEVKVSDLVELLDNDLRLVTPTSPDYSGVNGGNKNGNLTKHYQLTHDYLVPSIRKWLNQKKRETWKGRTELRLEELTTYWTERPTKSTLASLFDLTNFLAAFGPKAMNSSQRRFVKESAKLHLSRMAMVLAFFTLSLSIFWQYHANRMRNLAAVEGIRVYFELDSTSANEKLDELEDIKTTAVTVLTNPKHSARRGNIRYFVAMNRLERPSHQHMVQIANRFGTVSDAERKFVLSELEGQRKLALPAFAARARNCENSEELSKLLTAVLYLSNTNAEAGPETTAIFSNHRDPTAATHVTHSIKHVFPDELKLVELIHRYRNDTNTLFSLLIAAAQFDSLSDASLNPEETLQEFIQEQFLSNPDSGIHAACRYLALRWNLSLQTPECTPQPVPGFDWWRVQLTGGVTTTFVRVNSGEFTWLHDRPKIQSLIRYYFKKGDKVEVPNSFWIADQETTFAISKSWFDMQPIVALDSINDEKVDKVTVQEKLTQDHRLKNLFSDPQLPTMGLSYAETEKLVEWLRKELPVRGDLQQNYSINFPSAIQFQLAMRSGSNTATYFGDSSTRKFLGEYAVLSNDGPDSDQTKRVAHPYQRIPSRIGLCDMLGNVAERVRTTDRERNMKETDDDQRNFIAGGNARLPQACGTDFFDTDRTPRYAFKPYVGFRLIIEESSLPEESASLPETK